ncbi:MAG TPA: twin-arginine translocase TatA/TatE family subunit [Flavobacteriales bacterium]|nr:twin-arginine translocase TatA/TatE family subunit [Flavobacteriales bacterium]
MPYPLIFDISGGELLVVLTFALLFFGSKGIPDLARTLGRTMRQVRDASNEVQREIQKGAHDMQRTVSQQRREFQRAIEEPATPADEPPKTEPPSGGPGQ